MSTNGQLPASTLAPIAQGQLERSAAAAWNAMNVEARKLGCELLPTGSKSSYRTLAQQVELYNLYLAGKGNLAAKPGTSNHGWGLAVDLATPAMRTMVDKIGSKYGWSKAWSDAPSEWWHIKYQAGHYSGPDPGPSGQVQPAAPTLKTASEGEMALAVGTLKDGRLQVFAQNANDSVWTTWQLKEGGWFGAETGKRNAGWQSFGTPGK